jgi:ribosomal protein S18 acetylase RimI-like enzyme
MALPNIRRAIANDVPAVSETLGRAFMNDPVLQWLFPDRTRRERLAPRFFAWTLETQSLPLNEVWCTDDGLAAALWAPPDRWRLGVVDQLRLLPGLLGLVHARTPRILVGFNKLESKHPRESHWYLYFIGTRPDRQGSGYGSALLAHMLERADYEGIPAFLEAPTQDVIPFYRRHGFDITNALRIRNGPTLTQMWRDPHPPNS